MTDEQVLLKIQEIADETAKARFIAPAVLELIYSEKQDDGSIDHYVLGSDMPHFLYRIFKEDKKGEIKEMEDMQYLANQSMHYERDVKPSLKLAPQPVNETMDYALVVENMLKDGGVEIKLKSSIGRDITMRESFRYFDYVSRIFFVGCISVSFGALYLFSVLGEGKVLRLIVNNNEPELQDRISKIHELLHNNALPSYVSIQAANNFLLNNNKEKATVKLLDNEGKETTFQCNFCYDDYETTNRFAFLTKVDNEKEGIILLCDIFDGNRLIVSNNWTKEQSEACERIRKLLETNRDEFNKHVCPFFVDNLDFRYKKFKDGTLVINNQQAKSQEGKSASKEEKKSSKKETKSKKK